jgi:hypothetical protein
MPKACSARAFAHAHSSRSIWEYRKTLGTPVEPDDENIIQPRAAHRASSCVV